ncbi:MAG: hypothetical protein ACRDPY_48365 [Streptosporangiaceae bacterium]
MEISLPPASPVDATDLNVFARLTIRASPPAMPPAFAGVSPAGPPTRRAACSLQKRRVRVAGMAGGEVESWEQTLADLASGRGAWILAVRTTFSKAMATAGGGDDITDNAADAVYLVLMKGDFTLSSGGPLLSYAHAPTGHYFSAIFDAATFVTLEAGLGNHPPPVPLQTLGQVLNLT